MDYWKSLLVKFIEEKVKVLEECGIESEMFFNEEDKRDIIGWNKEDAERIWWKLEKNITNTLLIFH